ncbi:MAG: 3-oxoacyl-ACP reductase FabG [Syntrophobacterales bacterium]|nr:MAG: 3-oxoacyl-ACP reductase FabG [Syntrophobacterales bacterium]
MVGPLRLTGIDDNSEPFMKLKGKVTLITGAGQGIGKSIALKFAAEGADLALFDINRETCTKTAEECKGLGGKCKAYAVDVANREQVTGACEEVLTVFGRVDILVNNAGFDRGATLLKVTEEDWQAVLDVHLKGALNCIQALAPNMIGRKYGKIINISSIYGKSGGIAAISYSAAKGGILGLTKSIAKELGRNNINVNAILPGLTDTPTIKKMPERYKRMIIEATPLMRMARPEEIANVAAFLASDESSYITGATIEVTGGWMM